MRLLMSRENPPGTGGAEKSDRDRNDLLARNKIYNIGALARSYITIRGCVGQLHQTKVNCFEITTLVSIDNLTGPTFRSIFHPNQTFQTLHVLLCLYFGVFDVDFGFNEVKCS